MRPGYKRIRCIDCGVAREDAPKRFISTRGLCAPCGLARQLENIDSLEARRGIPYDRWRLGMVISVLPTEKVGELYAAGEFGKTAA